MKVLRAEKPKILYLLWKRQIYLSTISDQYVDNAKERSGICV